MIFKNNNRGSTSVITVLAMTVILGFSALVIDVGLVFVERVNLSNAVDAAALAGVQELPSSPTKAVQVAEEYIKKNGFSLDNIEILVGEDNHSLQVNIKERVSHFFAQVIGVSESEVSANSTAIVGPVSVVYDGIRPLVVEQQELAYGQQVVLKEGTGEGQYHGNFGAIALGGSGANVYRNNIKYGYKGRLEVGDMLDTEPGNMSGPTIDGIEFITATDHYTFNNYSKDSLRLWTIPIVDSLDVDGRKSVKVVGFAEFFIEDGEKKSGKAEIVGRFIRFTTNGDISGKQTDYGLNGAKLIN